MIKTENVTMTYNYGYYNWMTIIEYLSYFAELFGKDKLKYIRYIEYLLEKVGLSDKNKVPKTKYLHNISFRG